MTENGTATANEVLFFIEKHKALFLGNSLTDEEEQAIKELKRLGMVEENRRGKVTLTPRGLYCADTLKIKSWKRILLPLENSNRKSRIVSIGNQLF